MGANDSILPATVEPRSNWAPSIPIALAERGVRPIEADGIRSVYIPEELRQSMNVIEPVSELVQSDPLWQPSVRMVVLDVEQDTYPLPGGKRGLAKPAINKLRRLMGIDVVDATELPSLAPGVLRATATVQVRRSDGTFERQRDEATLDLNALETLKTLKLEDEHPDWDEVQVKRQVRRAMAEDSSFNHRKVVTAAILRAIRAIAAIPHAYPKDRIGKPFLTVGFNFSPDYSDPTVRAMLVKAGLEAEASVFGPTEAAAAPLGIASSSDESNDQPSAAPPAAGDGDEVGRSSGSAPPPTVDYRPAAGEHFDEPVDEDPPPAAPAATSSSASAGDFVVTISKHERRVGKTLAWLADNDDLHYVRFLAGLERNSGGTYFQPTKPEHHVARENALAYCHQIGKAEAA